jgi:hypothetical protein
MRFPKRALDMLMFLRHRRGVFYMLAILGYFCSAGDIKARRDSSRTELSYPAQKVRKMRLHPLRVAT